MRKCIVIIAAVLLTVAFASHAEARNGGKFGSEKNWTAHLAFGGLKLSYMDDEFSKAKPSEEIFGDTYRLLFMMGLERLLYQGYGTVGVEGATGFWQTFGKAPYAVGGKSPVTTVFNMIPLKGSAVYRFNYTWEEWGVPVVPLVKAGLDYYIWWILGQDGEVAGHGGNKGYGGTFGFHISYGIQLCLDFVDPKLANEFDQDAGVNNTYLYAEGTYARVNDFFSGESFDLSDHYFLIGLLFEI